MIRKRDEDIPQRLDPELYVALVPCSPVVQRILAKAFESHPAVDGSKIECCLELGE